MGASPTREQRSILDHLAAVVDERSREIAFQEVHPSPEALPPDKATESVTFRALDRRSDRIAAGLRALGVESGDVVMFQLPNWVEFPLVYLGAIKAGAVASPLLPALRRREVHRVLELCAPAVVVVPSTFRGFSHLELVEDLRAEADVDVGATVVVGDADVVGDDLHALGDLEAATPTADRPERAPDDLAQIVFTTGTTGEPKGVRQTVAAGMHQLRAPTEVMGITAADTHLGAMPLAHNGGFHYVMRTPLYTGCRTVLLDKWEPAVALETIREARCSVFIGPMVFLSDLVDQPGVEAASFPHFELFKSSGSARNKAVIERAYAAFEDLTIMTGWGQTENGMVTLTRRSDPPERTRETDGRAVPGMAVTVRTTDGEETAPGEAGELLVAGEALFDGYHRRPDLTDAAFTDDGWYRSGDLAVIDEAGYVRITGRVDDVIVRGGENVSATEVEEVLVDHPGVRAAAVVGIPDDRLGERPAAWVVPEAGDPPDPTALAAHLEAAGLQPHKRPEFVHVAGGIPRNEMGKIDRATVAVGLRERFVDAA